MRSRACALLVLLPALAGCDELPGPVAPELVVESRGTPFGIAVDGSVVYWTNARAGGVEEGPDGKVLKFVLGDDDEDAEALEVATALADPFAITLVGDRVVRTELGTTGADGAVRAVSKGGGTPLSVASAQAGPRVVLSDGERVYWVDANGAVLRALLPDGDPEAIQDAKAVSIALSDEDIYWTDPDAGAVMRANKALGDPEEFIGNQPRPRGIAVSGNQVWWTVLGPLPVDDDADDADDAVPTGEVRRAPTTGGEVRTNASEQRFAGLDAIAADDFAVYWLVDDAGTSAVARALAPDGPGEIISAGPPEGAPTDLPMSVFDITTADGYVYWTTFDGLTGRVLRTPR